MTGTRDSGGRVVAFARPTASLKRRAQTLRQKGLRVEAGELMAGRYAAEPICAGGNDV